MDDDLQRARAALVSILEAGDQPGARLKQQLQREFERVGRRFDERAWRYAKFSEFLAANDDVVIVVPHPGPGPGDVLVRLRPEAQQGLLTLPSTLGRREADRRAPFVPRELWQAFTNPDPTRRRFFNRLTNRVVHFVEGEAASTEQVVASDSASFVEIEYVNGAEQLAWMKEFISSANIADEKRTLLARFIDAPYSTLLSQVFTDALGQSHGLDWRRFKAGRVFVRIQEWSESCHVDLATLGLQDERTGDVAAARPHASQSSARRSLHTLVDLLSDSELESLLIPWGLASRITSSVRGK